MTPITCKLSGCAVYDRHAEGYCPDHHRYILRRAASHPQPVPAPQPDTFANILRWILSIYVFVAFAFAAVVTLWGNRHALAPKIHAAIDWLAAVLA